MGKKHFKKSSDKLTKSNQRKVHNKAEPSERFFKSAEEVENTPIKSTSPSLNPLRAPRSQPATGNGDKLATRKVIEMTAKAVEQKEMELEIKSEYINTERNPAPASNLN